MEYIYSVMVLQSAGKPVTEENVANIIKAAGLEPDVAKIKSIIASLQGVNIDEVIKNAAQMPMGVVAAAPAQDEHKKEKKEEKKEEEKAVSQEEAASGLSSLFGD
ncbi:MAG: 50S ribosomal protein P1 [Candidatus Thermoplasmatota archaeon]|nr:50S ribosomal protein P1 [Candidatus Thermoplasmatota archaeon]MCL5964031.1 50S ribosomal protein P1 [Candidatus Thermoplasmatota archaeon]